MESWETFWQNSASVSGSVPQSLCGDHERRKSNSAQSSGVLGNLTKSISGCSKSLWSWLSANSKHPSLKSSGFWTTTPVIMTFDPSPYSHHHNLKSSILSCHFLSVLFTPSSAQMPTKFPSLSDCQFIVWHSVMPPVLSLLDWNFLL